MNAKMSYFALPAILVLILALVPLSLSDYYLALLITIICNTALALSWQFFSANTKYVALGSAAFFGLGAYTMAVFSESFPIVFVILMAGMLCFVFAWVVGLVTLRLRGIYFTIFTFGLSEFLANAILWWETTQVGTIGRIVLSMDTRLVYYYELIVFLIFLLILYFLRRSKLGLALKAIGESEDAAVHCGVNSTLYKTLGFAISSMFMAFFGAIFATRWIYVDPRIAFNPLYSFLPPIMTILGGLRASYGPILGAVILSSLTEFLIINFKEQYMVLLGVIVVVLIILLPNGIAGLIENLRKRSKK
ncbi:MAG: branched-chain amino acid ABC transporter permease [Candidatus Bathyarchaeia archaeon]